MQLTVHSSTDERERERERRSYRRQIVGKIASKTQQTYAEQRLSRRSHSFCPMSR